MFWITGSKGLLGSALCLKCRAASLPTIETGREVDVADLGSLRTFADKNPAITHIINCAAFSQVDDAEKKQEEAHQTNALGPKHLAIVADEIGAKLIHISTDYVFSGEKKQPLSETDPVGPCNYYGKSKLEGEKMALGHCVIRTSWIFGNGGKNFVSKLLTMLQTEKKIYLTEDQWGRFTYAPDLADAILAMRDQKGLFQFANQGVSTRYEFGLAMRKEALLLGFPIVTEEIIPVLGAQFPTPCARPVYSAFNTSKIEQFVKVRHYKDALREFLCAQILVSS